MYLIRQFLWRFKCPSDIDAAADDFVSWILPHIELSSLDFATAFEEYRDPWFAWRRMIAARYGVATSYKPPDGRPVIRYWNRALWKRYSSQSPEELTDAIFEKVFYRLTTKVGGRTNRPAEQAAP
jgi:hypothetical protein